MSERRKTPLWETHKRLGARLIDFGGWDMPVQYAGTIKEHKAVREAVGLFDVSHMGEAYLRGPRAREVVAKLTTNNCESAPPGKAVYTLLCRPDGGVVDDCIFYKRADDDFMVIFNAGNVAKDLDWFREHASTTCDVVDISDGPALGRAIEGAHFDAVVHCAAKTKVVQSIEQPDLYRRVIVDGTRNVVAAALATGARDLVNISTGGAIYGETPECATEESPLEAPAPYGQLKAEAEGIAQATGMRSVTLRLANVYGPRQRTDLEGGVIAIFLGRWRAGQPLTIYGDGTAERDYLHVADVADAVLAALDAAVTGVYNIGTGVATSVNELVDLFTQILGPPAGVDRVAPRPAEIQRSCLDVSKAARDGLWRPRIALREGLERTIRAG